MNIDNFSPDPQEATQTQQTNTVSNPQVVNFPTPDTSSDNEMMKGNKEGSDTIKK